MACSWLRLRHLTPPPRLVGDTGAQQKREFKLRCERKVKSNLATIVHIRKVLSRDRSRHLGKACVLIFPSLPSILPSKLGGLLYAVWHLRGSACPVSWDLLPKSLFSVHRMTRGFGVFVRTSLSGSPPCLREIEAANHPLMMEIGKRGRGLLVCSFLFFFVTCYPVLLT